MRLDKYLAEAGLGSRKEVKVILKTGKVTVNDQKVKDGKRHVEPGKDSVNYDGQPLVYQEFYYYLLNKPAGVVSATKDNKDKTVVELLKAQDFREDLFPVGRLDKDTEGLLLLTNDGPLSHNLLSQETCGKRIFCSNPRPSYTRDCSRICSRFDLEIWRERQTRSTFY